MNISSLVPSAIVSQRISTIAGVDAIAVPIDPLADPALAIIDSGASVVDISSLGQLLSAVATVPTAQSLTTQGAGTDFGKFVSTAQLFVDALNNFLSSNVDTLQNPLLAPLDNALLLALDTPLPANNGESLITSLARIGINFQEASTLGGTAQFNIDLTTLQSAFDSNPAETSSVLTQGFQSVSGLAVSLANQNLDLFAVDTTTTQFDSALTTLFDVSTLTQPLATLNGTDAITVDAALQRLLVDQALTAALDANPATAQTVATTTAETATAVTNTATVIAPTLVTANVGTAQAANVVVAPVNTPAATQVATPIVAALGATAPPGASAGAIATPNVPNTNPGTTTATPLVPGAAVTGVPIAGTAALALTPATNANAVALATTPTPANTEQVPGNVQTTTQVVTPVEEPTTVELPALTENTASIAATPPTGTAAQATGNTGATDKVTGVIEEIAAATDQSAVITPLGTLGVTLQDFTGVSAGVPPATNDTGASTASTAPQALLQPLSIEGRSLANDIAVAAAVAAVRVNDVTMGTAVNNSAKPMSELIPDIVEVTRTRRTTLDPHDGTSDDWRIESARNTVQSVARRKALAASYGTLSRRGEFDALV